jgi:hypothetical protein
MLKLLFFRRLRVVCVYTTAIDYRLKTMDYCYVLPKIKNISI